MTGLNKSNLALRFVYQLLVVWSMFLTIHKIKMSFKIFVYQLNAYSYKERNKLFN